MLHITYKYLSFKARMLFFFLEDGILILFINDILPEILFLYFFYRAFV